MAGNKVVTGTFEFLDDTLKAVHFAKDESKEFKVYSPCPLHQISDAASPDRSPICWITGTGAVLGTTFGFCLTILCSLDWPIHVSAKPIVSVPAYIPVGYETTILFGAIITLISMFAFTKIPDIFRAPGYNPRFSQDRFGIVIHCNGSETDMISSKLKNLGAEDTEVSEGL